MTRLPSILYLGESARDEIPAAVITDLNLARILPEETCAILRRLLTAEEIIARQEIFRHLESAQFSDTLTSLSEALSAYAQSQTALASAKSELEELFLLRRRCVAFTRIHAAAMTLTEGSSSALLLALQQYFAERTDAAMLAREQLDATAAAVETLSAACIRFEREETLRLTAPGDSLCAKLEDAIRAVGCNPRPAKSAGMRIEGALSDAMARLYPDAFAALCRMRDVLRQQLPSDLAALRGEIDFYRSIHALTVRAVTAGCACCFPTVTDTRRYTAKDAYDYTLLVKDAPIVPNNIDFDAGTDVCFLTGANGGGKTTYLRCTAANLLLALCGCPVFAASMTVYPFRYLCTHFPADETFTGSGRLVEEAARVDDLLARCPQDSFVFLNETYSGTDDVKGAELTVECAARLRRLGAFGLYVTHFHEVASRGFPMLTTVIDERDSSHRTFRIVKQKGAGSSYAEDILKKYGLDAATLERRAADESAVSIQRGDSRRG